ncbi:sigma-70 family RNA polymerase sigma factor [Pseudalkalibacillus sp. R45]|uniref:sigma-70 family RNA polymerase sigma factor n=1 Tax=Pseudalkalibacillus sp. R45 TaxID=3457433 RepID=UPI003FCD082A
MILPYSSNSGKPAYAKTDSNQDREILCDAVSTYGKQLTNFAFSYVKDWGLSEDIVQEVFLKAFRNYQSFRGDSSFKTWLYKITANQCKDYLKSSYFKRVVLSNFLLTKPKRDEYEIFSNNDELSQSVFRLPVKYREIIILHYYEDLKIKEIANLLNMKEATVKTRLQRARTILKNELERSSSNEK